MTDAQPTGTPASGVATGTASVDGAGSGLAGSRAAGSGAGAERGEGLGAGSKGGGGARPRARRRRRTPWRAAFFALAGFGIIAAVAWALLGNRLFVVRSVTVTGTHLVPPGQVIAAAGVQLGTPILRVDASAVTRRVEAIRQVASATVTEDWPDHVAIVVTERVPSVAVGMTGGGYDLLDRTGTIVRWAKTRSGLPLLATTLSGGALRGDPGVAAAADVLAELDSAVARSVAQVSVAKVLTGDGDSVVAAQRVTLNLSDGGTVVWGDPSGAAEKNRELTILLRHRVRYVDVSAPGTVVTK
jgi:cell division septal protein FtsQ